MARLQLKPKVYELIVHNHNNINWLLKNKNKTKQNKTKQNKKKNSLLKGFKVFGIITFYFIST